MNERADFWEKQRTRAAVAAILSPPDSIKKKRMSHTKPTLPEYRLSGRPTDHIIVMTGTQRSCTYCRYLYAKAKQNETTPLPKVKKPIRKCLVCGDHLCSDHFEDFHKEISD
jgi:tRNA A37 methylthiotransferase MiaB